MVAVPFNGGDRDVENTRLRHERAWKGRALRLGVPAA
jgi:hypothetical protein